jgi:hypothetical protein
LKEAVGMSRGKKFTVDRRVGIAISALSPTQKAAVSRVLQSAQSFATFASDSGRVGEVKNPGQKLYTLRVSPNIRLIFTKTADGVQVLDLVERATLNRFAVKGDNEASQAKTAPEKANARGPKAAKAGALAKK